MSDLGMNDDQGGVYAKAFLDLKVGIGQTNDRLSSLARKINPPAPNDVPFVQSGLFPASGVLALRCGSPDQGHRWRISRLALGGATPTTVAAGRADVFVSAADPTANNGVSGGANGSLVNWVDQATTLPLPAWYGGRTLVVKAEEYLWVVISNGTVGQLYIASGMAMDYEEASLPGRYDL